MQTFRRLMLTYGVLALLTALFLFADVTWQNRIIDTAEGTVVSIKKDTYDYKPRDGSPAEKRTMNIPMIEYTYNGREFNTAGSAHWLKGVDIGEEFDLEVGDEVTLYVSSDTGRVCTPESYTLSIVQLIIAGIMLAVGAKGAAGYFTEFLPSNKVPLIVTCAATVPVAAMAVYSEFIFAGGGSFMPGLKALGLFIELVALMCLSVLIQIIVWLATLLSRRGAKKYPPPQMPYQQPFYQQQPMQQMPQNFAAPPEDKTFR